jgi:hypothetical protein
MLRWESRLLTRKELEAMSSSGERREPTLTIAEEVDRLRLTYGFWIIIAGFVLVAFITIVSTFRWTEVTSVATVVGAVASLVGTVVGAFFGVQVGAVGKEKAEASRERSEEMARAALSMFPPESAQQLRSEMNQ